MTKKIEDIKIIQKKKTYFSKIIKLCLFIALFGTIINAVPVDNKIALAAETKAEDDSKVTVGGQDLLNLDPSSINQFNPLATSSKSELADANKVTPAAVVGALLRTYVYPISAILLTALLVWGGVEIMLAGTSGKNTGVEKGKKRITAAIFGYALVMGSFLIIKIIETLLEIDIPGL